MRISAISCMLSTLLGTAIASRSFLDRLNFTSTDQLFVTGFANHGHAFTNAASIPMRTNLKRRSLKEEAVGGVPKKLNIIDKVFGPSSSSDAESTISSRQRRLFSATERAQNLNRVSMLKENFISPANGTDVITHPIAVIKCSNQTLCIQPKLQLLPTYDVYYCKHIGYGVRFYFLVKEGLLLHPNIRLVDDINKAQIVVYLPVSAPWEISECSDAKFKSKTVVLDEADDQGLLEPGTPEYNALPWLLYFKRSYVSRHNGAFEGYKHYLNDINVLPMTYTIVEAYVKGTFNMMRERDLDIVCTLRGSSEDPTRLRVRQWVQEYAVARGIKKYVAGEVNRASRTEVSTGYLTQMFRAKIIVTSNPSYWEGDFRLMEAIASGALILVDRMYVPRPYPLVEGRHIVYYDNKNKTDIFDKLDYYRKNLEVARKVAVRGYLHSMTHHRAANLLDYVFRTVHLKTSTDQWKTDEKNGVTPKPLPFYTDTGYDMRQQALLFTSSQSRKLEAERR